MFSGSAILISILLTERLMHSDSKLPRQNTKIACSGGAEPGKGSLWVPRLCCLVLAASQHRVAGMRISIEIGQGLYDTPPYSAQPMFASIRFLYEYSRRHPDYSVSLLLRLAKKYEATLEKCCAEGDPPACYGTVLAEFQPLVEEPKNLVKTNCELYEKLGEYGFQNAILVRYTQKAPQVSTPTLVEAARNLGRVGTKCCTLPEAQRLPCVEDYLSAILNRLCVLHEKTPVSEKVTKCCSGSLVERRPCFSALTVDETYVPKEFKAETFTFHSDICTLPDKEKQIKKQTALAELVKHKPKATEDQLKTVMGDFAQFVDKCCKAADKDNCFATEGPNLVARSKEALA